MKKQILYIFLVMLLLISGVSALTDQWCGLQSIYFDHGNAILPVGYESLNITPPAKSEVDETVTVQAATSPILIDSYISPQGYPGVTSIAAGTRTYNMYGYVNGATGITRFNVTLHTRDITGLETFRYQAYSNDINDLSVANQQFSLSHPQINMATTDRLVIRVYADTDSVSDKTVHWIYQGTTHSSRVDSAYFNCVIPTGTTQAIMPNLSTTKHIIPIEINSTYIKWNFDNDGNITWASLDGIRITNFDTNINSYIAYDLFPESKHTLLIYYKGEYAVNSSYTLPIEKSSQDKIVDVIFMYIFVILAIILILIGTRVPVIAWVGCLFSIMGIVNSISVSFWSGFIFMCVFCAGVLVALNTGE